MLEIGQFRTIAPSVSFDKLILENALLKQRGVNLTRIAVGSVIVSAILLVCYLHIKEEQKKKEIRIINPEENNYKKINTMESFIEKEKVRIYEICDILQASLETHYNLNPQINEAERKHTNWFLKNALLMEIDFLYDDPESYKGIYYDESEE